MSSGALRAVLAAALVISVGGPSAAAAGPVENASEVVDRRSQVVARHDCENSLASRDLTLFANGTLRLREREGDEETMRLGELTADEMKALRLRLGELDFSETDPGGVGTPGEWTVGCRLTLSLEDGPSTEFEYGQFDSLSLALGTAIRIIEELEGHLETSIPGHSLPLRYEPRRGDILERWDGLRFEVMGLTLLGNGVELSGVEVPLTIYLPVDQLPRFFVALQSRRESVNP